jgi:tRNA A37 threonylcarbamoyladenosine modification protein TsaB
VALALGIPLTGVGTLDMIGYASSCLADDLLASIPAGGGRLYVAAFDGGAQRFRRRGETRIMRAAEAAEMASEASLVCGPGAGEIAVELEQRGLSPRLPPPAWRLRRSGFLAELGRRYFEGGGADQVDTLEPQYVRRSSAEEKRFGSQE